MTTQAALKRFINRRHPDYEEKIAHWCFLEKSYLGGREWFEENIFRYFKEGETEFKDRLERAYRFNHTRETVNLVSKYIFKGDIRRNEDDTPQVVKDFWKRSTRKGRSIDFLMRSVSVWASVFGRVWVVVDSNRKSTTQSQADQQAQDERAFAYIVKPRDVLDMGYDAMSNLEWILIRETVREDDDPIESTGQIDIQFRLWTRTDWKLFVVKGKGQSAKVELKDEGAHDLGVVPVFSVDDTECDDLYSAPALIDEIAYLDRACANYLSNLDAIIQDQTFSQLTIPAQSLMPGDDDHKKVIDAGTKRIFTYDAEGGGKPEYIAPDPKQAQIIITTVQQIINEIYHTVGMAGERTKSDNAKGIDNSSGVAKAYDFERMNALLCTKAAALDDAENQLTKLVMLWNGATEAEVKNMADPVNYPESFDVRSLADEFEIASQLALIEAPDAIKREQMGNLAAKLFPTLGKTKQNKIAAEIKKWPESVQPPVVAGALQQTIPNTTTPDTKTPQAPAPAAQSAKQPATPPAKG